MFSYNITWGATKKEVERSNFWLEIPKILKRFWLSFATIYIPGSGIAAAYTDEAEFGHAVGFYLAVWFIFTFILIFTFIFIPTLTLERMRVLGCPLLEIATFFRFATFAHQFPL